MEKCPGMSKVLLRWPIRLGNDDDYAGPSSPILSHCQRERREKKKKLSSKSSQQNE